MKEKNLYQDVRKKICRMIYENLYQDGEFIPSERKLSEELGVSRVTVRKALKLLEEERVIERIQGSGTRVTLHYGAREGNMDIITLVAPAQNVFFSRFIDAFQTVAESMDSLVLFKQKPKKVSLEDCMFKIFEKDLKNVVLWVEDMELKEEALRKLRGLGMNIVLFDTALRSSYADAVCLDNQDAVERLLGILRSKGCRNPGFVGWDAMEVNSVQAREEKFRMLAPKAPICRVSWEYHNRLDEFSGKLADEKLQFLKECDGILYAVGELGMLFEKRAREQGKKRPTVMIDEFSGAQELGIVSMEQSFGEMSEQIFACLKRQNEEGSAWSAGVYQIPGHLVL